MPYTGKCKIKAIGAAGGYDKNSNSAQFRGRGARMIGTFNLSRGEEVQILVGHRGRSRHSSNWRRSSAGGGGGTFVVRGSKTPLIIAGGGGGLKAVISKHAECHANTSTTGNPGHQSGGRNESEAQTADDNSGENIL